MFDKINETSSFYLSLSCVAIGNERQWRMTSIAPDHLDKWIWRSKSIESTTDQTWFSFLRDGLVKEKRMMRYPDSDCGNNDRQCRVLCIISPSNSDAILFFTKELREDSRQDSCHTRSASALSVSQKKVLQPCIDVQDGSYHTIMLWCFVTFDKTHVNDSDLLLMARIRFIIAGKSKAHK